MARMRTIKPEACTSESLALVDRAVRWTFATLWTHCDDEGRAVWNPRLLKAALYPLDDTVSLAIVAADIAELVKVGAVCTYKVDGREYLHVPSWADHQHPNRKLASKLPPCPLGDHSPMPHEQRSEDAVSTHEASTPVVVVVDGLGIGEVEGAGRDETRPTGLAIVSEPVTAQTLVGEWIERCAERPPSRLIGQMSKVIAQLVDDQIAPDYIRRGIAAWMTKDVSPSVLPSLVNTAMNAPATTGRATSKAAGWMALGTQGA